MNLRKNSFSRCAAFILLLQITTAAAPVYDTDICIYGGTSGGIAAAVQASRQGKSVALAVYSQHLGGLTSE